MLALFATAWFGDTAVGGEFRFGVGGQLETQPHAVLDLGWRNDRWSVQLFTDTVDIRLRHESERGRANIGLRGAAIAANMWINPWLDGAPDPDEAHYVSYVGVDGELQRYVAKGFYYGIRGFVRPHILWDQPSGTGSAMPFLWAQGQFVAGLYLEQVQASVTLGVDGAPGGGSLHLRVKGATEGPWAISPVTALWAGAATVTNEVTSTRLGGLTPYHVPFAGAAWAEFWTENYAVGRLGVRGRTGPLMLRALVDVAAFTPPTEGRLSTTGSQTAWGLAVDAQWRSERAWFAQLTIAHSPTLPRGEGVWPVPVWFAIGRDWSGR